jgi:hypothetical protein
VLFRSDPEVFQRDSDALRETLHKAGFHP